MKHVALCTALLIMAGCANKSLIVTRMGDPAAGRVLSLPDSVQINCRTDCTGSIEETAGITLSARTTSAGNVFSGWAGDGCNSHAMQSPVADCVINNMGSARRLIAAFHNAAPAPGPFTLTVATAGDASGAIDLLGGAALGGCLGNCGSFPGGMPVVVRARPDPGPTGIQFRFLSWVGCDRTDGNDCAVVMTSNKTVTANFAQRFRLQVVLDGDGVGEVRSSDDERINCGNECIEVLDPGTAIELRAFPGTNNTFDGWRGGCTGTGSSCTVTMDAAKTVTATFTSMFLLKVVRSNSGSGGGDVRAGLADNISGNLLSPTINCGSTCEAKFEAGRTVTVQAFPSLGSTVSWGGACAGTSSLVMTCLVNMTTAPTDVRVSFSRPGL